MTVHEATDARVLVVQVGAERVALPLQAVREVVDEPTVVPVPMAPAAVCGHCNVRGQHLPVLDLGQLLRIPHAAGASREGSVPLVLVLVLATGDCALAVDDAQDVWIADAASTRALPAGGNAQGLVSGVLRRGDELALIVEADALYAAALATLRGVSPT